MKGRKRERVSRKCMAKLMRVVYNQEQFQLCKEPELIMLLVVTATTVMWLGHHLKSDSFSPCRKVTFAEP
jgi:hypothetical protein